MTKTKRKQKKREQTRNRKLIEKYPWLRPRNVWTGKPTDYNYEYNPLTVLSGWDKHLIPMMVAEMDQAIRRAGLTESYEITEIKEKYGTLRWYDNGGTEEMYAIINKYECISSNVCCVCGKPDVPMCEVSWISPYCEKCFHKYYPNVNWHMWEKDAKITDTYTVRTFGVGGGVDTVYNIKETADMYRAWWKKKHK